MTQHPDADELPGPDPAAIHERSVAVIRAMDAGDLEAVGGLLGELGGPEEFAAQVVSLASLARLLLDQVPQTGPGERRGPLRRAAWSSPASSSPPRPPRAPDPPAGLRDLPPAAGATPPAGARPSS